MMNTGNNRAIYAVIIAITVIAVALFCAVVMTVPNSTENLKLSDIIDEQIISVSEWTYDGEKLGNVEKIVVHYVANAGSSAQANRDYFNNLAKTHETNGASAHFVIGLDGEIIQCVPLDCVAWANGNSESNRHSISIECCHPDESGKFNDKTTASLRTLLRLLCEKYSLTEDDIIRHYDVTGKMCPVYYVKHENEWNELKKGILTE